MKHKLALGLGIGFGIFVLTGTAIYHKNFRMPLKDYTSYALYMAVIDDDICRRELSNIIDFPSKKKTLQYKYHLFLQMNKGKSRNQIEQEIKEMENRLDLAIKQITPNV